MLECSEVVWMSQVNFAGGLASGLQKSEPNLVAIAASKEQGSSVIAAVSHQRKLITPTKKVRKSFEATVDLAQHW